MSRRSRGWAAGAIAGVGFVGLFGASGYFFGVAGVGDGWPAALIVARVAASVPLGVAVLMVLTSWVDGEFHPVRAVRGWLGKRREAPVEEAGEADPELEELNRIVHSGGPNVPWYASSFTTGGILPGFTVSSTNAFISQPTTVKSDPGVQEFGGCGFAAGTVRGARSWNVDKFGRLRGVTFPQVWVPGENEAVCRGSELAGYPRSVYILQAAQGSGRSLVPTTELAKLPVGHGLDDCDHGFYGYYEGSNDYGRDARVSGIVEGYGKTIVGTRGFRCMKARILAVTFGSDVTVAVRNLVRRNYPDVSVFDSFEEMVAVFPPDAGEAAFGPDTDPDFWVRES